MHPNAVYAAIKAVIADLTGRPVAKITKDKLLGGKWPKGLNFTDGGVAGLVQSLNEHFVEIGHRIKPVLHPGEVNTTMSVGGLFSIIRKRV